MQIELCTYCKNDANVSLAKAKWSNAEKELMHMDATLATTRQKKLPVKV